MTMDQFTNNLSNCASKFNAQNLSSSDKKDLAIKIMSKTENITELAQRSGVSRNFLYNIADTAHEALDKAFEGKASWQDIDDAKVLFHFPVTKAAIKKICIALALICHSSIRGIVEFLHSIFDYDISVGTVFNTLIEATEKAKHINNHENLNPIKIPALDEIYHGNKPVLVVADTNSTYIALLAQEESCDGTTWGSHLLDLSQKKNLKAEYSIADGGKGLRAGQKEAWQTVPCHADIFHVIKDLKDLSYRLEKQAYGRLALFYKLQERLNKPKNQIDSKLLKDITDTKVGMIRAIKLADDVEILTQWLCEDILGKIGAHHNERVMLFNFVVAEFALRASMAEHFIKPVLTKLVNQKNDLLAFVALIDERLQSLADEFKVALTSIRKAYELHAITSENYRHYIMEQEIRKELGTCFHLVDQKLAQIIDDTIRASSCIENVNSRLRPYFFLRKQLGPDFLELLKFFLNHRSYVRSEHSERVGKSPAELLNGKPHNHWLELLGFQQFKRQKKASVQSTEACA